MKRWFSIGIVLILSITLIVGCSTNSASGTKSGKNSTKVVEIGLEGPNQWSESGTTYGPAWEELVANFEKENPTIKLKINVLPLATFGATEAAHIAAGTAPEIMFDQFVNHDFQLHAVNEYLNKPNPYVDGNKKWLDMFKPEYYNLSTASQKVQGGSGKYFSIPLNVVVSGLYYNKKAFAESGIDQVPQNFEQFLEALKKLKAHGYNGFGNTNTYLVPLFLYGTIANQLLDKYYDEWKVNTPKNEVILNTEDLVRAIKLGKLNANMPEIEETLKLMKEVAAYFPSGWSGVTDNSGAGVDIRNFVQEKSAIIWGVNFGYGAIKSLNPKLDFAAMPLPTVTTDTTPLSTNVPATQGASIGGTSYVIPASAKGEKLDAAIKFLQYATSPEANEKWLKGSSGNSVIQGVPDPEGLDGFTQGDWSKPERMGGWALGDISPQMQTTFPQIVEGYLLGTTSLKETQKRLQDAYEQAADFLIRSNPNWTGDWIKK